jgi:hypothetical protein
LEGFGGRGAVMVENLGLVRDETFSLVGEKSFTAIGANGKWRRRRVGFAGAGALKGKG